jgi:hypothetical protein
MDIKRIFASAIARRLAYLLAAALLAWLGLGEAKAQSCTTNTCTYTSEGAAFSGCMSQASAAASLVLANGMRHGNPKCVLQSANARFRCEIDRYNVNGSLNLQGAGCNVANQFEWHLFPPEQSCSSRPAYIGPPPVSTVQSRPRQGALSCINGCEAAMFNNGDGTWTGRFDGSGKACTVQTLEQACQFMQGFHWNGWNQTCEPTEPECSENQVKDAVTGLCKDACPEGMITNQAGQCEPKKDECPAGNIRSPEGACLPGEGQCAAGEARRENGTCGKDADGDGVADDDDDNPDNDPKPSFAGGDSCNVPPSCSGDVIMCGMARIQWRIECNTRKPKNVTGGSCGAMPVCVGDNCDALEYSQLLMQWRTACALEKMDSDAGGETGIKDHMTALKQAEVNALRSLPASDGHEGVDPNSMFHTFDNSGFNPNLFGGGASQCPTGWTMGGRTFDVPPQFWTIATFIGWLFVAAAYVWLALELGK